MLLRHQSTSSTLQNPGTNQLKKHVIQKSRNLRKTSQTSQPASHTRRFIARLTLWNLWNQSQLMSIENTQVLLCQPSETFRPWKYDGQNGRKNRSKPVEWKKNSCFFKVLRYDILPSYIVFNYYIAGKTLVLRYTTVLYPEYITSKHGRHPIIRKPNSVSPREDVIETTCFETTCS